MQAHREQDGKHCIGIGKPRCTVRWIDFIVTTVLTETRMTRSNASCQPLYVPPGRFLGRHDRRDTTKPSCEGEIANNFKPWAARVSFEIKTLWQEVTKLSSTARLHWQTGNQRALVQCVSFGWCIFQKGTLRKTAKPLHHLLSSINHNRPHVFDQIAATSKQSARGLTTRLGERLHGRSLLTLGGNQALAQKKI